MGKEIHGKIKGNLKIPLLCFVLSALIHLSEAQMSYPSSSNFDACQRAKIPCGGHTAQSCSRYCTNSGYSSGGCDGSCCLCSTNTDNKNGQYTTSFPFNSNKNMAHFGSSNAGSGSTPTILTNNAFAIPGQILTLDLYGNQIFQQQSQQQQQQNNQLQQTQYPNSFLQQQSSSPQISYQFPNNLIYFNNRQNRQFNAIANPKPTNTPPAPQNAQGTCSTQICRDEAKVIKSQMDERVNPCDDFYQFACGGFINQYRNIAHDQVEVTPFSIIRDKVFLQLRALFEQGISPRDPKPFRLVKTMYKSCMNTRLIESKGIRPLLTAIEQVGGWPVLYGDSWQPRTEFKWENFAIWFKEIGFPMNIFMTITVAPNIKDVGKRFLTIGEPSLGLSEHVLKRGLNEPVVNSYYQYMVDTAVRLGADRTTAKNEMLDAVNLEVSLAQCFYRDPNSRTGTFYNPMTIQELTAKYPYAPWLQLFQRIVPSPIQISNREVVMVSVPQYLDCFFNLLMKTEQKTMVNYAVWRAVSSSSVYLPESIRSLQQNFASKITGQKERKPRWKECTEIATVNMGNAAGAMYIRRYFKDQSKSHALDMVQDIQRAFLEILKEADWMDTYTKGKAREKALEMLIHIGYPEEHKSDAKITTIYNQFDFDETDYFGNIQNLLIGATTSLFGKLREPIKRNDWSTHGQNAVVNAFYQPQENSIQFPAAILQGHFFNASRPNYLNYAAVGWIMGHEITHGFDDQGHQFDKHGNHLNWWAPITKETYNKKKQCIVDQYSSYQSQGLRLNGERGQGENIADNGGIKQAYRGYYYWTQRNGAEKGLPGLNYSANQLFWISAAQNWCAVQRTESLKHNIVTGVHSPPEFRVKGTFSNSKEFARDFQCSQGSRMNPSEKCSVW